MDAGSGLIREAALTPAKVNETQVADELVSGDEEAVYADKAYESKERRLRAQGINDWIMHRSPKHQAQLPAPEPADRPRAGAGGEGVWHAEAILRLSRVRHETAGRGTTISALVEAGFRQILEIEPAAAIEPLSELPRWRSGGARVDVANRSELAAAMHEE